MANLKKSAKNQFEKIQSYEPKNEREAFLIKAFASLTTEQEIADFIRDLMTPAEITEFANRLEISKLLVDGHSYQKIAERIETSTTTVTRVAHWLFSGCGGYYNVLKRLHIKVPEIKE